ncbi:hypothetical protein NC651_023883 [Populus alba x Populus x berolinensis]|nr:hypothetical protein NC651_023883 [Populus alba x Populus x berolinensis]
MAAIHLYYVYVTLFYNRSCSCCCHFRLTLAHSSIAFPVYAIVRCTSSFPFTYLKPVLYMAGESDARLQLVYVAVPVASGPFDLHPYYIPPPGADTNSPERPKPCLTRRQISMAQLNFIPN